MQIVGHLIDGHILIMATPEEWTTIQQQDRMVLALKRIMDPPQAPTVDRTEPPAGDRPAVRADGSPLEIEFTCDNPECPDAPNATVARRGDWCAKCLEKVYEVKRKNLSRHRRKLMADDKESSADKGVQCSERVLGKKELLDLAVDVLTIENEAMHSGAICDQLEECGYRLPGGKYPAKKLGALMSQHVSGGRKVFQRVRRTSRGMKWALRKVQKTAMEVNDESERRGR